MWPFRRRIKERNTRTIMRRLIAGLVIGGAIGSIVGKKFIDKARKEHRNREDDIDDIERELEQ